MDFWTYREIIMKPDVYAGDNCDEVKHRWIESVEKAGDVQFEDIVSFDCKNYPVGTKIFVEIPVCPKNCSRNCQHCALVESSM